CSTECRANSCHESFCARHRDRSHLFVPGLVGIILQPVTLFLTSFAVVREHELGTFEQLLVTPVGIYTFAIPVTY
ncbi:MAG: hypothetical protein AB8B91_16415, partial [Rubripirellula sp.]